MTFGQAVSYEGHDQRCSSQRAIAGVAQPGNGGAANTSTTTITVTGNGTANAST